MDDISEISSISLPGGVSKSLVGKTPVSLLQELYIRKGITPKYDLIQIEGHVHEPIFMYRVTVGETVATGSGPSKKKAKHTAATAILELLTKSGEINQEISDKKSITAIESVNSTTYDDGVTGNPVGELQELCMNRRMLPPVYEVNREEGQPHERSFIIVCLVGSKFSETGHGKSKKIAKRLAARRMLAKLQDIPAEREESFIPLDEDELGQRIAQRNVALRGLKSTSPTHLIQESLLSYYDSLKMTIGEKLSELQTSYLNEEYYDAAVQTLEEIAKEQDFKVTYVDIEERSKMGNYHCLIQLSTHPATVSYGIGVNSEDAKLQSAFNALEYLRIITKSKS